jgi:hypothetical protein
MMLPAARVASAAKCRHHRCLEPSQLGLLMPPRIGHIGKERVRKETFGGGRKKKGKIENILSIFRNYDLQIIMSILLLGNENRTC